MKADKSINMKIVLRNSFILILLIIFWAFSSLGLNLNLVSILPLIVAILLVYPSESDSVKIFGFAYSMLFMLFIKLDLIRFDFIPQARVLLELNESIFYWFSIGHVHAIRLLVAYPGYLISQIYNVDLDTGFTYYGMMLFIFMYLSISNTIEKLQNCRGKTLREIKFFILLIPFLILPLIMNGRLILSYLGYSILINLYTDLNLGVKIKSLKVIVLTLFGLSMSMVSSGTMTVALLYVIFMTYAINHDNFNRKKFLKSAFVFSILLSPLIYKVIDYTWLMVNRNLIFYGEGFQGFVNMLNHGLGRYFHSSDEVLFLFFVLAIIILLLNYTYLKTKIVRRDRFVSLVLGINIAAYGLLFSFSMGLMMIPPLIIYILVKI